MPLTRLERKMVEGGYDHFTLDEKNMFIQELARRKAIPVNQITDEYILDYHKSIKKSIFSSECQNNIKKGFTSSNGHKYRTEYDDQINFMGKMIHLLSDTSIDNVFWKTEDEGYLNHVKSEWITVFNEAINHKELNIFKYNSLLSELTNAITHDDLIDINWNND